MDSAMTTIIKAVGWVGASEVIEKLIQIDGEWDSAFERISEYYQVTESNVHGWIVGDNPAGFQWICWLKEGETFRSGSFLKRFETMKIALDRKWTSHEMKKNTTTLSIR